ncbi:hypothetical protein L1049_012076 [Liquidambar formosana]|uniref:DUF7804 domain-containing protein n=1 Tax=Liquidambar formosana TaxID=63359 RepID=A0AAP0WYJ0_LIQFO
MASLGIRCGGNPSLNRAPGGLNPRDPPNARSCSLVICNHTDSNGRRGRGISTAATATATAIPVLSRSYLEPNGKQKRIETETVGYEKIDEWMRDSVVEIVKNLREAPLLVQVYSKNDGATRLKTEKAVVDDWPVVAGKWKDGEIPLPEGVILVEELKEKKDSDEGDGGDGGEKEAITKAWGIVIQGKGVECGPACYLLKTSRVRSGLGLFCTHFCLVKVKSFMETAQSQLTKCWLS